LLRENYFITFERAIVLFLSASRLRVCAAHKIACFQLRRGTRLLPDFLVQGCFPFSQEICIGS
jgi:hypothetical protein